MAEDVTDEDEGEAPAPPRRSRRKLLMIGLPALLLILGGGAYGAHALGLIGGAEGDVAEAAPPPKLLYYDLPEMIVNLSSPDRRSEYLKIKVALEMDERETLDSLPVVMPRIQDAFQVYLRELRASDLEGSAGLYRMKEELLRRINMEIHPREVTRVLFKEIIVQ
jgi:flagellar FliL protein